MATVFAVEKLGSFERARERDLEWGEERILWGERERAAREQRGTAEFVSVCPWCGVFA